MSRLRYLKCCSSFRYDYVEVFDGENTASRKLGRYCNTVPTAIVSRGSSLLIRFRSDYSQSGRGFHARYVIGETIIGIQR
jgi:hypothetical protein